MCCGNPYRRGGNCGCTRCADQFTHSSIILVHNDFTHYMDRMEHGACVFVAARGRTVSSSLALLLHNIRVAEDVCVCVVRMCACLQRYNVTAQYMISLRRVSSGNRIHQKQHAQAIR